jgi:thiol:disulfide interchange protein DsbD
MFFITIVAFILFGIPSHAVGLVDSFQQSISSGEIVLPLLIALASGFLTALSPCVYPLIPITLSIMGARRSETHLEGFLVALSYVGGMTLVYSLLGVFFAYIGVLLGSFLQHPVILIAIAIFFAAMALSMFGVFNIAMPTKLLTKLTRISHQGFYGAFLMGLVAGLIAAPCTGPVLGVILTLIASERNILFGLFLMIAFSLGMGALFLMLGTFSSVIARLPKSGAWMDSIKYFFGAAILSASLYYFALAWLPLQNLLTALKADFSSYLAYSIILGAALLFVRVKFKTNSMWDIIKKTGGVALIALSIAAIFQVEPNLSLITEGDLMWHVIDADAKDGTLEKILQQARMEQKPVMLDFYADWCVACKQLEHITFKDCDVILTLKHFSLIRIDASNSSKYLSKLQSQFEVTGLPTVVFIDKNNNVLSERLLGFSPPQQFLTLIKDIR